MAVGDEGLDLWAEEVVPAEEGVAGLPPPVQFGEHDPVADEHSLEVEFAGGEHVVDVVEHLLGQLRDVHTAVGLARDPEAVGSELREDLEPLPDGDEVVGGGAGVVELVVLVLVDGKSYSGRTLQKQQVGLVVPGEGVDRLRELVTALPDQVWPDLLQPPWVSSQVPSRLEHPGPPFSHTTTSSLAGWLFEVMKT